MSTETLLVELGTEELPPKSLQALGLAFRDGVVQGLTQRELTYGAVTWFASPRRLAVLIADVQLQAPNKQIETLGPPVDRAKDADGNWTPAAAGFARKQGVEPEQLQTIETPKGQRLGLSSSVAGAMTSAILANVINESITDLPIPKKMRWGASRTEFVRPVQWVVAMLGQNDDFGQILGQPTGRTTEGHRFHSAGPITLSKPEDYESALAGAHVIASFEARREKIREQVESTAASLNANAVIDPQLLDEVTGLVEWPVALAGSFEERFLAVPSEALILSMKEHQKYFHVEDENGALLPYFITVSNIESTDPGQVIRGNERVIRPRLSDAAFFFDTDKKVTLESRVEKLSSIVFQHKLGSLHDKTLRVSNLAGELARAIAAPQEPAKRAGLLCKADLLCDMVQEFSDMQGIAGYYYAVHDGETEDVAKALEQQYWPRFSGDKLPESETACVLALADRLDTLCGIFGIGQPPTGSKDPFALRRASLAVLRIIVGRELPLDLRECLALAIAQYPDELLQPQCTEHVFDYMIERFRAWYEDENIAPQVFKAVAAKGLSKPLDIQHRVHAVDAFTQLPEAEALAGANKRVSNILAKLEAGYSFGEVSTDLLQEAEEIELWAALKTVSAASAEHYSQGAYTEALACLAAIKGPVDDFFDGVMVNAEDPDLRQNRLNLLHSLRELFEQVADISLLVVSK